MSMVVVFLRTVHGMIATAYAAIFAFTFGSIFGPAVGGLAAVVVFLLGLFVTLVAKGGPISNNSRKSKSELMWHVIGSVVTLGFGIGNVMAFLSSDSNWVKLWVPIALFVTWVLLYFLFLMKISRANENVRAVANGSNGASRNVAMPGQVVPTALRRLRVGATVAPTLPTQVVPN